MQNGKFVQSLRSEEVDVPQPNIPEGLVDSSSRSIEDMTTFKLWTEMFCCLCTCPTRFHRRRGSHPFVEKSRPGADGLINGDAALHS